MSIVTDGLWAKLDAYLAARERDARVLGHPLSKATLDTDRQRIGQFIRYLEAHEGSGR